MRDRLKIRRFISSPIGQGTLTLVILLAISAGWLSWGEISYLYPGPAIATGMLAIIVLVVGVVMYLQQAKNWKLLPTITGLEKLVERWQVLRQTSGEEITSEDSQSIYQQLLITQLYFAKKGENTITIERCFLGGKPEKSVLLVSTETMSPQVVKFEKRNGIDSEIEHYNEYVKDRIGIHTPGEPSPHKPLLGRAYGAIVYAFAQRRPNTTLGTFGEYCYHEDTDVSSVTNALNETLRIMNALWQRPPGTYPKNNSLYVEYDRLQRHFSKMQTNFQRLRDEFQEQLELSSQHFHLKEKDWQSDPLCNPLDWVESVFGEGNRNTFDELCGDLDALIPQSSTIVHGDFHTGNILVECAVNGEPSIWIIDFPHVHIGPTVQDIARLEADIKSLLPEESLRKRGLRALYDFEEALPAPSIAREGAPDLVSACPIDEEHFRKAWAVVCQLRAGALSYVMGGDPKFYYLALLHATLPILYYRDRTPHQKLYAFISAALLCERLGGCLDGGDNPKRASSTGF